MTQLISTFPSLPLTYDCQVVWEARDPATGDLVSGVVITDPVLYGLDLTGSAPVVPTVSLVPAAWVPLPVDQFAPDSEAA